MFEQSGCRARSVWTRERSASSLPRRFPDYLPTQQQRKLAGRWMKEVRLLSSTQRINFSTPPREVKPTTSRSHIESLQADLHTPPQGPGLTLSRIRYHVTSQYGAPALQKCSMPKRPKSCLSENLEDKKWLARQVDR